MTQTLASVAVTNPEPQESLTTPDVVARVEATLEQIDELWAELDRGEFKLMSEPEPKRPTNRDPRPSKKPRRSVVKDTSLSHCKVSIVIPVYNERQTILQVIERVRQLPLDMEIIVVDDCSTDGTRGWLETMRGTSGLHLIFKDRNEGKGAALRTGFDAATGDVVIVQDADLEYDPNDIPAVIRPIVMGRADASFGSRYMEGRGDDGSWFHRLGNRFLTSLSNRLNGVQLTDMETCYKAFRKNVLSELDLRQNRFGFEPEITAKIARRQYRIQEVPIHYSPRGYAEGKKIGVIDLVSTLYCILRYGCVD
jgi:glycosyltransferase involved in cell wall biosynthesis